MMFDVSRRHFELRKNFKFYGPEDRSRYTYQGDLFNVYSNKNNEFLFKYGFLNETVSIAFLEQNLHSLKNKNIKQIINDIDELFKFLFEDNLNADQCNNLATTTSLQIEQIEQNFNGKTILELGPGNGLVGPLFAKNFNKKFTYILVEAVPQLYVLQQNVLKYFSIKQNKFEYCSSLNRFEKFSTSEKKPIILHLQAWQLKDLKLKPDLVVANNVFDQVSSSDFLEYYKYIKNNLCENGKISIWGGIERSGVKDLYLFGFGTYHNHNIIDKFKGDFVLKKFEKIGSEFYSLFEKSKKKSIQVDDFVEFEKKLIEKYIQQIDHLWIDDNANFLIAHQDIFDKANLNSYSTSVSTAPLPCNIKRNNINKLKIKLNAKFLVASYRWVGIKDYFISKNFNLKISKLTDRIFIMEIIK